MPLYYEYEIQASGEYRHTHIRVYDTDALEPIEKTIAGCVGNAAGYQSQEIADRLLGEFCGLRDRGVTGIMRWTGDVRLDVRFQHYQPPVDGDWNRRQPWEEWEAAPQYCDAGIELPSSRRDLKASYELLLRIERNMKRHGVISPWHAPSHLLGALARMRAERVYRMHHGQYGSELCAVNPRTAAELAKKQWSLAS